MLQRFIYTALQRGHDAFRRSGLALYQDLFQGIYELSATETLSIQKYFERLPVKIHQGWPRDEIGPQPTCYIFPQGESQPGYSLNDFGGVGGAPITPSAAGAVLPGVVPQFVQPVVGGSASFILSSLWTHQYQILGLARGGPEPLYYLTEINKAILLAAKNYFLSKAMQSCTLAVSDVTFRDDLAPSDLFARTITLQCGREFSQADTSQALQDAFKLPNIIGPEGSDTHPVGRPPAGISVGPPAGASDQA